MAFPTGKYTAMLCFSVLPLLIFSRTASTGSHVKTLPGFPGELPFYVETGYVSVDDVEYFYYFVKSQSNPATDPLLLFANGGPGCSALNGFFYEIGPLQFQTENYTAAAGIPTLLLDPYGWTKIANIIFLDAPVGTGFTYATTTAAWSSTDTLLAQQLHIFTRKWLQQHSDFLANPFYLATDSYTGVVNPIVAQHIIKGNEAGMLPFVNIKGLSLSCPHTYSSLETDATVVLAHRLALISDELYQSAKNNCKGNYFDPPNAQCTEDIESVTQLTNMINDMNMLLPLCALLSPEPTKEDGRRSLGEKTRNFLPSPSMHSDFWCKNYEYLMSYIWANAEPTRAALGVRNGTVVKWVRCNTSLDGYTNDVTNAVPYHKNLTKTGLQLLVFSGDHDMIVPHLAIEQWIKSLGLTVDLPWRPWFVDGQVAGYTVKYSNDGYRLTYATLKGAGHSPPEFNPVQCYELLDRWIHYYPI